MIGPNGAGKTTFLDVITGKTKPTEGQVVFKGTFVARERIMAGWVCVLKARGCLKAQRLRTWS